MPAYAAGVLPFTKYKGRVLWLIAEDVRDGSYSDFGGKAEKVDNDIPENCAMREFLEESYGLVLSEHQIMHLFKSRSFIMLRSTTRAYHPYFCYVIQVPFVPHIRDVVRKLLGYFRMKNVYRSFVEKTDLRWVTTAELFGSLPKRQVFANTIALHRATLESLECRPWKEVVEEYMKSPAASKKPFSC